MAFTFLKAQGINVGASLVDNENLQVANKILSMSKNNNTNLVYLKYKDCREKKVGWKHQTYFHFLLPFHNDLP